LRIIRRFYGNPPATRSARRVASGQSLHSALERQGVPQLSARKPEPTIQLESNLMSKGMDQKKSEKKKPEKTLKEKRAAKAEKKKSK